jgi:hypothetical protein
MVKFASSRAHYWDSSFNIIWMIKSKRRNGRACNIYGEEEKYVDVLVRKPERDHLEYVEGFGKIILKWLLKK